MIRKSVDLRKKLGKKYKKKKKSIVIKKKLGITQQKKRCRKKEVRKKINRTKQKKTQGLLEWLLIFSFQKIIFKNTIKTKPIWQSKFQKLFQRTEN